MDSLHRETADKVQTTIAHLMRAIDADRADLALAAAKRGRRQLTLLVQQIAVYQDATRQEATSNE